MDNNHDSIIAAGNGTNKPVKARLTFFYAGGTKQYQMEQTIAADGQMWVDVGKLIREGVPDKQGNVLPSNLTTGAYQLLDIDQDPRPSLYEGKVVTDKTWGHATYGCMVCCGFTGVYFNPFDAIAGIGGSVTLVVLGRNSCSGGTANLNGYAKSWGTDNPAVMTLQPGRATGVGLGSTVTNADLPNLPFGPTTDDQTCPTEDDQAQGRGM